MRCTKLKWTAAVALTLVTVGVGLGLSLGGTKPAQTGGGRGYSTGQSRGPDGCGQGR